MNARELRDQTIQLACATEDQRRRIIAAMAWQDLLDTDAEFERWAHENQIEPASDGWRTWLMMAGRGFGKTRAGAEWIYKIGNARPGARIALVGATIADARTVMVEGVSGVLARQAAQGAAGVGAGAGPADLAERKHCADLFG
jgi:Uncharacterized conserved protein